LTDRSIYERILCDRYARLPSVLQRFHRLAGRQVLHGCVETLAPATAAARFLALCLGTPRAAASGPLRFELETGLDTETWIRCFPTRTMTSKMCLVDGRLEEHLGAARLTFELVEADGVLRMELAKMRFLGVPCPRWLMPRIVAEEVGLGDRLHFTVSAALPVVGVVASYRGHLDVLQEGAA
jgi:hypothetical protein